MGFAVNGRFLVRSFRDKRLSRFNEGTILWAVTEVTDRVAEGEMAPEDWVVLKVASKSCGREPDNTHLGGIRRA
jgi:hypothetical protein